MSPEQLQMTGELGAELAANDEDLEEEAEEPTPTSEPAELVAARALLALPVGLHLDVPELVYHARVLGFASKSALDVLQRSAKHYRAWVAGLRSRSTTAALHLGKAVHCAVLEPERFSRAYVIAPKFGDLRRKANKEARKAFLAENAGATILSHAEGATTLAMIHAAAADPTVAAILQGSRTEVTARWDEREIACKARTDIDNSIELALLADIKSAEDASPSAFERAVWNYGYHRQDDWYRRAYRALGLPVENFVFVVIEKEAPHAVALYELDDAARERGRRENDALLMRLARCIERDEWPGYSRNIEPISLPRWAAKEAISA